MRPKAKATKNTKTARPVGRPSTYDAKYCDEAIACLTEGHSLAGFAGRIKVSRATIYTWTEQHPEFLDAVKTGQARAIEFWEARLIDMARTGKGNVTAIIFGLKNRAAEEWKDRIEHTGKDGAPISHDLSLLSDADLSRLERIIEKAAVARADQGRARS